LRSEHPARPRTRAADATITKIRFIMICVLDN
jgi:hypothetical protein